MNLWHITEERFDPKKLHSQESVYTIGNGYFATRGTFEEGYFGATPATLLYGVFDDLGIGKEELANAPDWLPIQLFVNGERFRINKGKLLAFSRTLDLKNGVLSRTVHWESPEGIRLKISSERFASLADEHLGMIRYSVTAEEEPYWFGEVDLLLRAFINTAVGNDNLIHWESIDQGHDEDLIWLVSETCHSSVQLAQTLSFTTSHPEFSREMFDSDIAPGISFRGTLKVGETVNTEKIVVMYTTRDTDDHTQIALEHHNEMISRGESGHQPETDGFLYNVLLTENNEAWQNYWKTSDIIIEGDDKAQQAIRYNLYQLRISASSHDSRYSIAAKGLTGFGQRGHVSEDTEIYMLPYFTYVHPDIARNLLLYRYRLLPSARAKAAQDGYDGALYPWESTLDDLDPEGRLDPSRTPEATPEVRIHPETQELIPVLNGRIELHITASIAFAVCQYWHVTGDDEFMQNYGSEIVLSTAMFWASRAEWDPEHKDCEITNVIGPDQWHEHVNNNAYTNYMARWNIQKAFEILNWLRTTAPDTAEDLIQRLDLNSRRLNHWSEVATSLRIPQDRKSGLVEQFDGFFYLEPLDQTKFRGRRAAYLAILGMHAVQEYRIIKQADVLMLLTILNQPFDLRTKEVNWDYYYPITDHDYGSYLSSTLHVILACELGHLDIAYHLYMKGTLIDLENLQGDTPEGIHYASCGAAWQAAVFGFAGLRLTEDGYTTAPRWPDGWTRLAFTLLHKGEPIFIDLRRE